MSIIADPFPTFGIWRILACYCFEVFARRLVKKNIKSQPVNSLLASLKGVKDFDPSSTEYKEKVSEMRERLKANPELVERLVFYAELAVAGDSKASELLRVLDDNGYLRIACAEIIQENQK